LQGATESAVKVNGGVPRFFNCMFRNNSGMEGGAIRADGVARMRIEYCVFADNHAEADGGAVWISNVVDPTAYGWGPFIGQSLFDGNDADLGGGVFIDQSTAIPQFSSCVFYNNSGMFGGGLAGSRAHIYVTNSTFYRNHGGSTPAGARSAFLTGATIVNSIFWGGEEADTSKHIVEAEVPDDTGSVKTTACLVEADFDYGFWQSNPNFEDENSVYGADGFFGTDDDGLHLSSFSPVRDGGIIDRFVNHQPWDAIGNARLVGRKIDLGAFETQRSGRLSPPELMEELRTGRLVLFFRHAKTDWDSKDPGPSPECFPGRNLIDEGREQSREVGRMMRAQGLLMGDGLSSPVCRCWETVELMVGYYEKMQHWASGGGGATDSLRNVDLSTIPFNGNRIIVSHDAVCQQVFNPDGDGSIATTAEFQESDCLFVKPDGESYEVLAHWCSDTWRRYRVRFPDDLVSVEERGMEGGSPLVHPNPASDVVTLTVDHPQQVSIVSILGELIWSGTVTDVKTIDLSAASSGTYVVYGSNGNSSMLILQ